MRDVDEGGGYGLVGGGGVVYAAAGVVEEGVDRGESEVCVVDVDL